LWFDLTLSLSVNPLSTSNSISTSIFPKLTIYSISQIHVALEKQSPFHSAIFTSQLFFISYFHNSTLPSCENISNFLLFLHVFYLSVARYPFFPLSQQNSSSHRFTVPKEKYICIHLLLMIILTPFATTSPLLCLSSLFRHKFVSLHSISAYFGNYNKSLLRGRFFIDSLFHSFIPKLFSDIPHIFSCYYVFQKH